MMSGGETQLGSPPPMHRLSIRCRQIRDTDVDDVINLLLKSGFGGSRAFWTQGLARLSNRVPPVGFPKYGYLLEVNHVSVGILLVISSSKIVNGQEKIQCNVSSWYVWPAFASYATMLVAHALKRKDATYLNISALPHTWPSLKAQGYKVYCKGRFIAVTLFNKRIKNYRIIIIHNDIPSDIAMAEHDKKLIIDHAEWGFFCLLITTENETIPLIFEISTKYRFLKYASLIYCKSTRDFERIAGVIGRFFAKRAVFFFALNANCTISGLIGWSYGSTPKYFRGPDRPSQDDLAYSERAVFGLRLEP